MKIKWNFNFLREWTVGGVTALYRIFVLHFYFILSNLVFLATLLVFRLTLNNFILFLPAIFLFLVSIAVQFKSSEFSKDTISISKYFQFYKGTLRQSWRVFLSYTALIFFVAFDVKVILLLKGGLMLIPLLITASFLASGMFFVFLLSTDERAVKIPLGQKFFSMLLVSYRLPFVTLINVFLFMVMIFLLQNYAMLYLLFFGGALNALVLWNLKRRFSVDLYFEQSLQLENEREMK